MHRATPLIVAHGALPARGWKAATPGIAIVCALFLTAALPVGSHASKCARVESKPCKNCFAVFVMPDTQGYIIQTPQPRRMNHLELVGRYICANKNSWLEPSTGKTMPIVMVLQLGDLVNNADRGETGDVPFGQWLRLTPAFDRLDACGVRYLVTVGNHDLEGQKYEGESESFNRFFGVDRWKRHQCRGLGECSAERGEWFLGGGDPIRALSRNNVPSGRVYEGGPGPLRDQPARHRVGIIRTPDGRRMLFLGLELAFDFPPAAPGFEEIEGDDLRWLTRVLETYPDVTTVIFHHTMFWAYKSPDLRPRFGFEAFHADSLQPPIRQVPGTRIERRPAMRILWDRLIAQRPQIRFVFTGHVLSPRKQADYTIRRPGGPPVFGMLRNYQGARMAGDPERYGYGAGWNVIAAFDPDASEVRIRSYRIDDEQAYADPPRRSDHVGKPAPTECLDTDRSHFPERVIKFDFQNPGGTRGISR